jgi:hypothetical protein
MNIDNLGSLKSLIQQKMNVNIIGNIKNQKIINKIMKQTALQWLYKNLKSHFEHDGDLLEAVQISFNIAKEKEMKQIMDANIVGINQGLYGYRSAKEYYNKTFKKK